MYRQRRGSSSLSHGAIRKAPPGQVHARQTFSVKQRPMSQTSRSSWRTMAYHGSAGVFYPDEQL